MVSAFAGVDSDGLWIARDGIEFPLREMSDGYRAVTALVVDIVRQMSSAYPNLALLEQDGVPTIPYPGVVLIDEVDAHLHVSWQKMIGTWLKSHFPEIQFIVTTHSPYVCQSADPGGLILLPGPGEHRPPRVIGQDLYQRVVYGSGDDAILSELFGVDTPYSAEAEMMRERLGDLEIKVLDGTATVEEIATVTRSVTYFRAMLRKHASHRLRTVQMPGADDVLGGDVVAALTDPELLAILRPVKTRQTAGTSGEERHAARAAPVRSGNV